MDVKLEAVLHQGAQDDLDRDLPPGLASSDDDEDHFTPSGWCNGGMDLLQHQEMLHRARVEMRTLYREQPPEYASMMDAADQDAFPLPHWPESNKNEALISGKQ